MGEVMNRSRAVRTASCCLLCLVGVLWGITSPAHAAEAHVFDPVLSLTGNCITPPVDPVEDPGCPYPAPPDGPSGPFTNPDAVATDSYGDIYVASFGQTEKGEDGRIDIFDAAGFFITELAVTGPRSLAVDKAGNLYVVNGKRELLRYPPGPSKYEPASGEIEYGVSPVVVKSESGGAIFVPLAINPVNQHLFAGYGPRVTEFGSAAEGNIVIDSTIGETVLPPNPSGAGVAVDAAHGRLYVSDLKHSGELLDPSVVRVFELESPHALIETIDGSTTPAGRFRNGNLSLAVEESTGNLFVYDGASTNNVVFELAEHGEYLNTISYGLEGRYTFGSQIAIDNGEHSPNGALDSKGRYLYVPAFPTGAGHSFAYGSPTSCPATIESTFVTSVTESEAQLHATIEPCSLATTYSFEYTTQQRYEEEGNSFAGAQVARAGELPAGAAPVDLVANLAELVPGTAYRFRVVAENEKGSDEVEMPFSTYPETEPGPVCENAALRTESSKLLPDCRAYELVTPPDTNAHAPVGVGGGLGTFFATREASPSGNAAAFEIEGGSIPGFEATGSLAGDPYLATRTESGWKTTYVGPTGGESPSILPGSNSPDQGYSFWSTGSGEGSAAVEGESTTYIHYPDGRNALIGRGSLGSDPRAVGVLISEGGGHVIFVSGTNAPAVQLEPTAPPSGTKTIYDRVTDPVSGEEETEVVSLLPGNVTPAAGEDPFYQGASLDGRGVAFSIGKKLYLRYNDEETYEVGEGVTFAGIAEGGRRIFYLEGSNLFAYEVGGEEAIQFTSSGDITPINVAAEGHVAYFVSPSVLAEPNPNGAAPLNGQENLYRSEEGLIGFVGTVTKRDVEGEFGGSLTVDGLGLWTAAVGPGQFGTNAPGQLALDPSRTTPDGNVLLFESRAVLAGYDPEGHAEVYRYDFTHEELECLSCNPTQAPASGDASLETLRQSQFDLQPLGPYAFVPNLRADGRRAFFQSTEQLVPGDTDGLLDVYEWEAQGVGSCNREGGCVYLISSGHSHHPDFLFSASDSGDDVFFRTSDLLLPSDADATPSIYDARVGGGFPQPVTSKCQGEECRPTLTPPPGLLTPGLLSGGEIPKAPFRCPKGKRRVKRNGKLRCVKVRHKHHRRRSHTKRGAGK